MHQVDVESFQPWIKSAASRIARKFGADREDCEQWLAYHLLQGMQQKFAYLKTVYEVLEFYRRPHSSLSDCCDQHLPATLGDGFDEHGWGPDWEDAARELLTYDEHFALALLVRGNEQQEIAHMMSKGEATVSRLLSSARAKLKGQL